MKLTTMAILAAAVALPGAAFAAEPAYKADCSTVDKQVQFVSAIGDADLKLKDLVGDGSQPLAALLDQHVKILNGIAENSKSEFDLTGWKELRPMLGKITIAGLKYAETLTDARQQADIKAALNGISSAQIRASSCSNFLLNAK